jgi:hypothetical protein
MLDCEEITITTIRYHPYIHRTCMCVAPFAKSSSQLCIHS